MKRVFLEIFLLEEPKETKTESLFIILEKKSKLVLVP